MIAENTRRTRRETVARGSAEPKPTPAELQAGPRLVTTESANEAAAEDTGVAAGLEKENGAELPPPPTAEESLQQKSAYEASAQRLEDLVRAQNPALGRNRQLALNTSFSSCTYPQ